MPDRSIGLMPFDVLVWGAGEPSELRDERAKSGAGLGRSAAGTFVIILPAVGDQTWTSKTSNELHDIMPAVTGGAQGEHGPLGLPRPW